MTTIDLTALATVTGGRTTDPVLRQLRSIDTSLREATQQPQQPQLQNVLLAAVAARTLRDRG